MILKKLNLWNMLLVLRAENFNTEIQKKELKEFRRIGNITLNLPLLTFKQTIQTKYSKEAVLFPELEDLSK